LSAERSGNLDEVLGRYIAFQQITVSFRKKLISSLWYPALLIGALAVMLTFLMTYVVPQFADLYTTLNAKLPAITVVMLNIGRTIQHYYYIILAVIVAVVLLAIIWARSERGSKMLDAVRYRLPLFGEIWMKYQIAMFS